jgi:hypothetical protein
MRVIKRNNEMSFVVNSYIEYLKQHKDFPKMFNPYNQVEITNIAPTLTCGCGSWQSSATICIFEE